MSANKLLIFEVNLPTAKDARAESKTRAESKYTTMRNGNIATISDAIVKSCEEGLTECIIPLMYLNRDEINDYIGLLKAGGYKARLSFWGFASKKLIIKW